MPVAGVVPVSAAVLSDLTVSAFAASLSAAVDGDAGADADGDEGEVDVEELVPVSDFDLSS
ncbi:MAG: hypothetical protein ACREM3_06135 [Candidatus Rokuibacteriota bacterium]